MLKSAKNIIRLGQNASSDTRKIVSDKAFDTVITNILFKVYPTVYSQVREQVRIVVNESIKHA